MELLSVHGLVVHGADGNVVFVGGCLGAIHVVARGGGHVEAFGGLDELVVVNADEFAIQLVLKK